MKRYKSNDQRCNKNKGNDLKNDHADKDNKDVKSNDNDSEHNKITKTALNAPNVPKITNRRAKSQKYRLFSTNARLDVRARI